MVWVFGAISIAVYGVDTFTAINLLAFNKWSSQIQPKIPIRISRWIFAGAIIASFVLLIYRWFRAIRVMRTGGIAESYLDPLAVRVQSVRIGKHKGYRRFLVFAELTKSKKGADYIALFSYFSFEGESSTTRLHVFPAPDTNSLVTYSTCGRPSSSHQRYYIVFRHGTGPHSNRTQRST